MNMRNAGLLSVAEIDVTFGHIKVLDGLSLKVDDGEFVSILGPNGAGKTTCLRAISGLHSAISGSIMFDNAEIRRSSPQKITRMGIALVPEGRKIFPDQSVFENLLIGAYTIRRNRALLQDRLDRVMALFPRLKERRKQAGGTLSGGEAQMLAIGRALMANPRLLMLDEPTLGLAPQIVDEMFQHLGRLHHDEGIAILLVEQAVSRALAVADRAYLIGGGRVVAAGSVDQLRNDPLLEATYLGK